MMIIFNNALIYMLWLAGLIGLIIVILLGRTVLEGFETWRERTLRLEQERLDKRRERLARRYPQVPAVSQVPAVHVSSNSTKQHKWSRPSYNPWPYYNPYNSGIYYEPSFYDITYGSYITPAIIY